MINQPLVPWKQISCNVLKNIFIEREVDENAFWTVLLKNYHANYNAYFPLKVKGLTGKNIFIHAQRLPLELYVSHEICQNPITQCKFKTDE